MARPDVLIVGGGAIGAACARSLSLAGQSVLLVDGGTQPGAATPASAGMLAPLADTQGQDPLLSLRIRARDLYRDLVPTLEDETGIDVGFWTDGIVQLALSPADVDRLKGDIAWQRQQGFPVDWLGAAELRERCPGISPEAQGGHLSPEDGALEPPALMDALIRSATAHGATLQRGQSVEQVVIEGDRAVGVRLAAGTIHAGSVLIAAGCWSGRVGGLPRPLSVEPVRGQMAALGWPLGEPRAIVFSDHGYVLTRGGEAVVGSTMEHVGFDASVSDEAIARILSTARRVYPALEQAPERRRWAGLRPATPDGAPIVGRDPQVQNLWYATGHGRNGILLAAITAQIIGGLMTGQAVEHDVTPLSPARFWNEA
jgi:glycine oxidase